MTCVTWLPRLSCQSPVRLGVVLACVLLAVAGCTANGPAVTHSSPSPRQSAGPTPSPSPSPTPSPVPSPSPSPSAAPSPVAVPAWAAMHASCTGAPATQEALLVMQGSAATVLADVTDARNPKPICTITGPWTQQLHLVTQTPISWPATEGSPSVAGDSVIGVLDLFTGNTTVAATWSAGAFIHALHPCTPPRR